MPRMATEVLQRRSRVGGASRPLPHMVAQLRRVWHDCTHGNPRPCRVPIMNVSFRRSRTVPASKPVADPARSTDPRDYQRVGRPLGVMAKTFPAGFVVAEHRHERAQLIHALSGVIELHVGRTLWLVLPQRAVWMPAGMAHAMLARGEVRLHTVYVRPQSCPPEFPGCRAE